MLHITFNRLPFLAVVNVAVIGNRVVSAVHFFLYFQSGTSQDDARAQYIALVKELKEKYSE